MRGDLKTKGEGRVVALALTWDGARWPSRNLPPKARAFLARRSGVMPVLSEEKLSRLFAADQVREISVCWVPRLKGGAGVLADAFQTATGMRIGFKPGRMFRFGDVLGVVYRRSKDSMKSRR